MSKKNRDRGKRHERAIAKLIGGRRVGILGKHDVEDHKGKFSVECKSREVLPKWFQKMWEQAERNCPEMLVPLLVIHKLNQRYEDDWVIMKMKDFLELRDEGN